MKEQNFDKQIRDSLGDYHSKLDTGALWKDLAPQLAADKKRRRGIFWWWSGAGACLALAAWGWFATQNPQQLSVTQETAIEGKMVPSAETAVSDANSQLPASDHQSKVSQVGDEAQAAQQPATIATPQTPGMETPKQRVAKLPKSAATLTGKHGLSQGALPENGPVISNVSTAKNSIPVALNEPAIAKGLAVFQNPASGAPMEPGAAPVQTQEANLPLLPQPASIANVREAAASAPLSTLTFLEIKSLMLAGQLPARAVVEESKTPKSQKRQDFLIRPNFEVGYTFKTLGDSNSPDTLYDHLNARRESEEALEYLHGSLLLGMRHQSGWYALTGLGYTSITERFSFTSERTERDSVNGITEIYINAQGDSIQTQGLVARTRHITYRKRTYGSYTLLDVPIIAGYDWEKGRWSFGAEAGVFVNISLKAKGDALDLYGDFIRLEDSNWFKPSIGLSYYGSLRVWYALDKKTRISLGPTFRYIPDISNRDNNYFVQKYSLFGLNLGLARQF